MGDQGDAFVRSHREKGRELAEKLSNARTLRLDELFERFAVAKAKRIEVFGKRLEAILAELDKRDLASVETDKLLSLALKYGERMATEAELLTLKEEDPIIGRLDSDEWPA